MQKIAKTEFLLPGTVRTTYLRCGKPTCKCSSKKQEDKHGPYFFWDRKVNGTLSSMSLDENQKIIVQRAIQNRKKFEALLKKLYETAANEFLLKY